MADHELIALNKGRLVLQAPTPDDTGVIEGDMRVIGAVHAGGPLLTDEPAETRDGLGLGPLSTIVDPEAEQIVNLRSDLASGDTGKGTDLLKVPSANPLGLSDYLKGVGRDAREFGIKADGSDETAKVRNAILECAQNRQTLVWPETIGEIGITNFSVFVQGGLFDWAGKPKFRQLAGRNPGVSAIELGGASVTTTALAESAASGSIQIKLADASLVQPGDIIRLRSNRLMFGDHRFDEDNAFGQVVKVVDVLDNTVTIADPLVFDLIVGELASGTAQGGASGQITLASDEDATRSQLKNYLLRITSGTGAGQSRYIHEYNESTKVVSIGTTYTSNPQSNWNVTPDETSVYEVAAECIAAVYRPATTRRLSFVAKGYVEQGVSSHGCQVSYCDSPVLNDIQIEGFSRKSIYTYRCYSARLILGEFEGANHGAADGGGLGYGHMDVGSYNTRVFHCLARNCRTGFDAIGGSVLLERKHNTVIGGGRTYDGNWFWPTDGGYMNSGVSSHTGSWGITDDGNTTFDVWDNKQRGLSQVAKNNVIRGWTYMPFRASYTNGVIYKDNTYEDGFTVKPSQDVNGNDGLSQIAATDKAPQSFLDIRQDTLVENASIVVDNNTVKSTRFALVGLSVADANSTLSLTLTNNDVSFCATGGAILAFLRTVSSGDPTNLRDFIAHGNTARIGGAILGSVKTDNFNPYMALDQIALTQPKAFQIGVRSWLCLLPDDSAVTVPVWMGQTVLELAVFEKDYAVTHSFKGIVQLGNTTPIHQAHNTNVEFRTSVLSGTTGTDGELTLSVRSSDGRLMVENRTGLAGRFVVSMSGLMN